MKDLTTISNCVERLLKAGWTGDESNIICSIPNWKVSEKLCAEAIESLVHEVVHSRIIGGREEMLRPKTQQESDDLIKLNNNQIDNEVLTTAVTIKACYTLGADVKELALQNLRSNVSGLMSPEHIEEEYSRALQSTNSNAYAKDVSDYIHYELKES